MKSIRILLAIVLLAGTGMVTYAGADQKQTKPPRKRPVIIHDPSAFRPPPPPHERSYVGPGPTVVPPMERVPPVPPLAQPPIR